MVAAVSATLDAHTLPRRPGELPDHLGCDRLLTRAFEYGLGTLGVGLGLISCRLEAGDAVLQRSGSSRSATPDSMAS